MPATPINASILAITFAGTKITHQLNAELKASMTMRESLTKDNDGYKAKFPGARDWELSGESEVALDAAKGFEELYDAFIDGSAVAVEFITSLTGDTGWSGNALLTELSMTAGVEDNVKMTYTLRGSGAVAPIVYVAPEGD
jgi:predicted secreted protein